MSRRASAASTKKGQVARMHVPRSCGVSMRLAASCLQCVSRLRNVCNWEFFESLLSVRLTSNGLLCASFFRLTWILVRERIILKLVSSRVLVTFTVLLNKARLKASGAFSAVS